MIVYESPTNTIHRADAREVAAEQEPGSFALAVLDGPYGMRKAAWDMMKVSGLPEWYAPHLDDVGRLCAPSASLYVWNTAEGWATLHPGIVARGWRLLMVIVWHKTGSKADNGAYFADAHEVCVWYVRETYRERVAELRRMSGLTFEAIGQHLGCSARLPQQWERPADALGNPCRPDHARMLLLARLAGLPQNAAHREYLTHTVRRHPFVGGVGNVWAHGQVQGPERLRGEDGATLHPCQKPITFADRIIRASSRPGERVWVPFGGTCREAVAAEWMARAEPSEARQVVTCEIDEDGRDYLGAVVRQLRGEDVRPKNPRQGSLFGGAS